MTDTLHVCLHGHFYQPPRENPWLDAIEREPSAAPAHDWNTRITDECYAPNANARILDASGRVTDLVNNYAHMSFNTGPTLLRWLEVHNHTAYTAMLDADRAALARSGHGNALAQVYNHIIMPLANRRDKVTQVRWGIADFVHRFGRRPEGMWLAETAADAETLEVLAAEGIAFTVLAPQQATRFRFLDGGDWQACPDASIPTGRAYLFQGTRGRPIHVFFYDGEIARGVAFDRLLADASHLVDAVDRGFTKRTPRPGEQWLVSCATDGESYGHHFKFGEMALAATFKRLLARPDVRVTNYAAFLASQPVIAEVGLLPVSSWSCAHGVGRWSADCGCRIGAAQGTNQQWRAPLRTALDALRDALAVHFERVLGAWVKDPWAVRDRYIEVILKPSSARAFVARELSREPDAETLVTVLRVLEMQRAALLMFTSCGWFFDDISGPESLILLKVAARAAELARASGAAADLDATFRAALAEATSNSSAVTGSVLYETVAVPAAIDADRAVVSTALRALTEEDARKKTTLYTFHVTHHDEVILDAGAFPCVAGHVTIEDTRTLEQRERIYALAHLGGLDVRCTVAPFAGETSYNRLLDDLRSAVLTGSALSVLDTLDGLETHEAARAFGLRDAFADLRARTARGLFDQKTIVLDALGDELFDGQRGLIHGMRELEVPIPAHVKALLERALTARAAKLVNDIMQLDIAAQHAGDIEQRTFAARALVARLKLLAQEARALGLPVSAGPHVERLALSLVGALLALHGKTQPGGVAHATRLVAALDALAPLGVTPHRDALLRAAFDLATALRARGEAAAMAPLGADLDRLCGSAFFLREP